MPAADARRGLLVEGKAAGHPPSLESMHRWFPAMVPESPISVPKRPSSCTNLVGATGFEPALCGSRSAIFLATTRVGAHCRRHRLVDLALSADVIQRHELRHRRHNSAVEAAPQDAKCPLGVLGTFAFWW
jgi:hypothetical protein